MDGCQQAVEQRLLRVSTRRRAGEQRVDQRRGDERRVLAAVAVVD